MTLGATRRRTVGEIEGFTCLLDDAVAEKAYEVIYQCSRPKGAP